MRTFFLRDRLEPSEKMQQILIMLMLKQRKGNKIPGRTPVSASLGPYGAQIAGSTGAFRKEVDKEEDFFESESFFC